MIPIMVLMLVGALVTYGLAIAFATEGYDQALVDSVHSIASHIVSRNGNVVVDLPPVALEILKDNVKDKLYYQVKDSHGDVIASDTRIPDSEFGAVPKISTKNNPSLVTGAFVVKKCALPRCYFASLHPVVRR